MIGVGSDNPQDACGTPGIAEPAPRCFGKLDLSDIMRAAGEEQHTPRGGYRGGEAGELAITAQRRRHILAGFGECGWVCDHDVEALTSRCQPSGFAKGLATAETTDFADPVARGRRLGESQRRFGTVDAEHRSSAGSRPLHGEGAV